MARRRVLQGSPDAWSGKTDKPLGDVLSLGPFPSGLSGGLEARTASDPRCWDRLEGVMLTVVRDEGVPQILIRNNVPASCVLGPPMDIALFDGPGRQSIQPAWLLAPSEMAAPPVFPVAHPGSANLDVGAPTSSPVPGALILMGPVLVPALACLNSSGPASGRHVMSGLARAVRFAACTNLPVQDYVPAGLCRQATAPHLSTYASRTHKVMPFLSFLHVLWLVASPLAEPVLNKWFRSWTYWVTQPIDHPSPLACAEQPVCQIDVLDLVW
ncbi:hypothetical protein NM208_g9971 [Fusarium decemcellulare]|uniref:Uncharacterized protein n=1 Tax=Fusarium decemcellulare TaxID=57161 RepID=A0ACC1RZM3_9HYPO|nr:hypothetical protein NM208_g9971 [Fusarium decemcellulare]